ncbi:small acid-soluble spore protein P [Paenibacillaceae bacterium]|nr:small acid-soluble spore protein P [Paenibacillaceae bacterium]
MSKPDSQPVPQAEESQQTQRNNTQQQEPNSGSKKTKQANHTRHNNGEG